MGNQSKLGRALAAATFAWVFLLAGAHAAEPSQDTVHTFTLNRLDPVDAVKLLRSSCEQAGDRCIVTPLGSADRPPRPQALAHLNVTAAPTVLKRLESVLAEKDGPAPSRQFRIYLVEASNSDLGASPPLSDAFAEALRAVREVLPFKYFHVLDASTFVFLDEGRLSSTQIQADTGDRYTIEMIAGGALDAEERLFVQDFKVKRDDRALIDSQFYVEFGKPLVIGTSGYPNTGRALFVVLIATEKPGVSAAPPASVPVSTFGQGLAAGTKSQTTATLLSPEGTVQFATSRNSVINGGPFRVGDLALASDSKAERLQAGATANRDMWSQCARSDPRWVRLSDDGTHLDLAPPRGSPTLDKVLTAYCSDGIVVVGGYERRAPDDDTPRRAWLYVARAGGVDWAKQFLERPFVVGSSSGYRLEEVQVIDPGSGEILFGGVGPDDAPVRLSAPFKLTPPGR